MELAGKSEEVEYVCQILVRPTKQAAAKSQIRHPDNAPAPLEHCSTSAGSTVAEALFALLLKHHGLPLY